MKQYDHKKIENAWQKRWAREGIYKTPEHPKKTKKHYVLDMFPYPSGEGLHVGHPKGYIATDIFSRFKRMNGFSVLHPMGWDAFGLPAENFALKHKIHPQAAVSKNIKRFKEQLSRLGFDYDWKREINTTDPRYYAWTQWIFLKLFERGLAYESDEPINWCPSCKTGLANEDVEDGKCERCGSFVEKKKLRQWVLKIREYADRLLTDLDSLPWPESIKESQRNWIGKSEGWEIQFLLQGRIGLRRTISNFQFQIKVFTTRPDTLFGATYMVLAPEHPIISNLKSQILNWKNVERYIEMAKNRSDLERVAAKEKTGVKLEGIFAINPANGEKIPVYVADYVLLHYGTGAIMAVPAHDERDFEFAKKHGLPIRQVICAHYPEPTCPILDTAYVGDGFLVGSGTFSGLSNAEAKEKIADFVGGVKKVNYKLRDWVFSRQRYWGEPIPLIFCEQCKKSVENSKFPDRAKRSGADKNQNSKLSLGERLNPGWIAVPEKDLPVKLPAVKRYEPTGTGESPLANIKTWVNVKCPRCGGAGRRETNTMPQWAGSSWYYIAYGIRKNSKFEFQNSKLRNQWLPVDSYVGGTEHATRHLIYARFWHKFLYDAGVVKVTEPFLHLKNQGLILGEDGRKMSKRWGNVVNPDDIVERFGADSLRVYEMFMGPFSDSIAWNTDGVVGARRFLERVWNMGARVKVFEGDGDKELESLLHRTIKKVTEDILAFKFNTAVSALMICVNEFEKTKIVDKKSYETILTLLAPFSPHITEELWHRLGRKQSIHRASWPTYDEKKIKSDTVTIAIQVDGKVRDVLTVGRDEDKNEIIEKAKALDKIKPWVQGGNIEKTVYIVGRLLNLVTKKS